MRLKNYWIIFIVLATCFQARSAKKPCLQKRKQKRSITVRKPPAKKPVLCAKTPYWTKRYQKVFTDAHAYTLEKLSEITLSSIREQWHVLPFSQLIMSWNAIRPKQGYFCFSVRARNKMTQKWLAWHKTAEWGHGRQKSFQSIKQTDSTFNFVRLELDRKILADAFEIKIEAKNGASLKNILMIAITTSYYKHMTPERVSSYNDVPSVIVQGVPKFSQWQQGHPDASRICSPTSTSMLISYLTGRRIAPYHFAQNVYDNGLKAYGSWPFNTAYAFEACQAKFFFAVTRLHSFRHLLALLRKKIPVVVSVRGKLKNAPRPYPHGHLLIVVGYNAKTKKVLCHDPAQLLTRRVFTAYPLRSFLRAWEKSHRLSYVATPRLNLKSIRGDGP